MRGLFLFGDVLGLFRFILCSLAASLPYIMIIYTRCTVSAASETTTNTHTDTKKTKTPNSTQQSAKQDLPSLSPSPHPSQYNT